MSLQQLSKPLERIPPTYLSSRLESITPSSPTSSSRASTMTAGVLEQRNPYKGTPPRAWLRLRLLAADGSTQDLDLLSDTGSPYGLIVSTTIMNGFKEKDASDVNSNYGPLTGGWLQVAVPAIGFDRLVIGYASDGLVAATQLSNPD